MLRKYGLYFAWILALAGTLVTLFLSEVQNWPVCHLCWYQRICLYPLSIILGIACFQDDRTITRYIIPLTIIGALLALYQYLQQMIPGFEPIKVCGPLISCSLVHMQWLGFITIPFLSLSAFVFITFLLIAARR